MDYVYQLLEGDKEIMSFRTTSDKSNVLITYVNEAGDTGSHQMIMRYDEEEILRLSGLTRQDAVNIFELLKNEESGLSNSAATLTKGRKIGVKVFVGLFMTFGILSLLIRSVGYARSANNYNVFNLIVTIILMLLLGFGLWIYFFPAIKKEKKVE